MDLKTGFHQIRTHPENIEKTDFNTKYGHFEFDVILMGLCNATATLQALMSSLSYESIDVFLVAYINELIIFGKTVEDLLQIYTLFYHVSQ